MSSNKCKKRIISIIFCFLLIVLGAGCSQTGAGAKVAKQLEMAVKYLSENKFEKAVLAYNEAIKIDAKSLDAFKGLAKVYILQGKHDEAEKVYQQGVNVVDKKEQLYLGLASFYMDRNDIDQAKEIYNQLIKTNPKYIPAYEGLARLLLSKGEKDKAISFLLECVNVNKDSDRAYSLLAEAYISIGDNAKALKLLTTSLGINLNQQAAYLLVERIFNKDWSKVINYGNQLLAENEEAGRMLKIIGYYNSGQYTSVTTEYEAMAIQRPQIFKATVYASRTYLKINERNKADSLIREVDLQKEKNPFVYADVARYYLEVGDIDKARNTALTGIKVDNTCLGNYSIIYEIAKLSNNEPDQKYYTTLFLTASVDSTRSLLAELKSNGMKTELMKNIKMSSEELNEKVTQYLRATYPKEVVPGGSILNTYMIDSGKYLIKYGIDKSYSVLDSSSAGLFLTYDSDKDKVFALLNKEKFTLVHPYHYLYEFDGQVVKDINNDNIPEWVVASHVEGSGGFAYCYIYTYGDNGPRLIYDSNDYNEPHFIEIKKSEEGTYMIHNLFETDPNWQGSNASRPLSDHWYYWNGGKYVLKANLD